MIYDDRHFEKGKNIRLRMFVDSQGNGRKGYLQILPYIESPSIKLRLSTRHVSATGICQKTRLDCPKHTKLFGVETSLSVWKTKCDLHGDDVYVYI